MEKCKTSRLYGNSNIASMAEKTALWKSVRLQGYMAIPILPVWQRRQRYGKV